jgi:multidrug efflux pump subunit AcrA (membrane-fusion protein)
MLAEMNLPILRVEAKAAALAAQQQVQVAKCERETALREAAAARREAQRARQDARQIRRDVTLTVPDLGPTSIMLKLDDMPQMDRRIQVRADAMQRRVEVRTVHITADQLEHIDSAVAVATANLNRVDFTPVIVGHGGAALKCPSSRSWSQQMQVQYGNAMRHALQSIHNSINVTNVHQGTGSSL